MASRLVGNSLRLGSTGRLASEEIVSSRLCGADLPRALAATAGTLPQTLLLLLKAMQEVDDDIADAWEKSVEALLTGFLAESLLEDGAQKVGHRAKVLGIDTYAVEGATGNVELIAQTDVDIRDLALTGSIARPLGQSLKELLGSDEQVCNALFDS